MMRNSCWKASFTKNLNDYRKILEGVEESLALYFFHPAPNPPLQSNKFNFYFLVIALKTK